MRGGSGLGDSIYLRPIVEHLLQRGDEVTVCTNYPGVFEGLSVEIEKFNRERINITAHYTIGKDDTRTNQWQDICRSAGIEVPLRFEWRIRNYALVNNLLSAASGRPIVLVHGGREPMGRGDGFGMALLPEREAFVEVIETLWDCYCVEIGNGEQVYALPHNRDMKNTTSITDLFDLAKIARGIIAQCSFCVPLAEALDKPLLCVWAWKGLRAQHMFLRQVTPDKVLSKPSSRAVWDNEGQEKLKGSARAFRRLL